MSSRHRIYCRRRCVERAVMKFSQNTGMVVEYVFLEKVSMYSVTVALKANFLPFQKLFKSNQGNN